MVRAAEEKAVVGPGRLSSSTMASMAQCVATVRAFRFQCIEHGTKCCSLPFGILYGAFRSGAVAIALLALIDFRRQGRSWRGGGDIGDLEQGRENHARSAAACV